MVLFILCFGVEFLCCLNFMYVFVFYLSSSYRVAAYWERAAHSAYDTFSNYKYSQWT